MLVAGCILYRQESKNRTQMELYVVVLVPDLPLLISVSSLEGIAEWSLGSAKMWIMRRNRARKGISKL